MKTISDYSISCTAAQTQKALELGAPIEHSSSQFDSDCTDNIELLSNGLYAIIPTAEQMVHYLRMRGFKFSFDDIYNYWAVSIDCKIIDKGQSKDKELVAIDAALEYLSKQTN